jgi:hypothetical protein
MNRFVGWNDGIARQVNCIPYGKQSNQPFDDVIFGALGSSASKKRIDSLYFLFVAFFFPFFDKKRR